MVLMMQRVSGASISPTSTGRHEDAETGGGGSTLLTAAKACVVRGRHCQRRVSPGGTIQKNGRRTPPSSGHVQIRQERSHARGVAGRHRWTRLGVHRTTPISPATNGSQSGAVGRGQHALLLGSLHL